MRMQDTAHGPIFEIGAFATMRQQKVLHHAHEFFMFFQFTFMRTDLADGGWFDAKGRPVDSSQRLENYAWRAQIKKLLDCILISVVFLISPLKPLKLTSDSLAGRTSECRMRYRVPSCPGHAPAARRPPLRRRRRV